MIVSATLAIAQDDFLHCFEEAQSESAGTGDCLGSITTVVADLPHEFPSAPSSVPTLLVRPRPFEAGGSFPSVPVHAQDEHMERARELSSRDYTHAGHQRIARMGHEYVDNMYAIWTHPSSGAAIFVGDWRAAQGPATTLISKGITHIVNCAEDLDNYCEGEPSLAFLRFHVIEWAFAGDATRVQQASTTEQLSFVQRLFDFVDGALSNGRSVLVHCRAGMHRAGTTGVLLRMYKTGEGAGQATKRAQAARSVIRPDELGGPNGTLPRLLRMFESSQARTHRPEG